MMARMAAEAVAGPAQEDNVRRARTVLSVIVGSTREGRFAERPAQWIMQHVQRRDGVDARLLDLREFPMPFFDQPVSPATPGRAPYGENVVKRWTDAIAQSDGFIFVTPEYNFGPPAVLKNAIDWVYQEWNRKAAAFVSYGSALGARGVQQLRETAIELQLAPVRSSVHVPVATLWAHYKGGDVDAGLSELDGRAEALIDDLLWWTAALKAARARRPSVSPPPPALLVKGVKHSRIACTGPPSNAWRRPGRKPTRRSSARSDQRSRFTSGSTFAHSVIPPAGADD